MWLKQLIVLRCSTELNSRENLRFDKNKKWWLSINDSHQPLAHYSIYLVIDMYYPFIRTNKSMGIHTLLDRVFISPRLYLLSSQASISQQLQVGLTRYGLYGFVLKCFLHNIYKISEFRNWKCGERGDSVKFSRKL